MSAEAHRLAETTKAGLVSHRCGCPMKAATAAECLELRNGRVGHCLCVCHGDAPVLAQREYLRQYFDPAARC